MTNKELAAEILERFMPIGFKCNCQNCQGELADDVRAWAQRDTVERIAEWISERPATDSE
jgi:hypothetical protein